MDLNTSNVNVNHLMILKVVLKMLHLNTSNVNVNHWLIPGEKFYLYEFKYI